MSQKKSKPVSTSMKITKTASETAFYFLVAFFNNIFLYTNHKYNLMEKYSNLIF